MPDSPILNEAILEGIHMGQPTSNISRTLNGFSSVVVGGDTYWWSADRHLLHIDVWVPMSSAAQTATFSLTGSDWGMALLRFAGNAKAVINDSATGSGRYIEHVALSNAGGNSVTLNKTTVAVITGSSGADKITIGSTFVGALHLGTGNDTVVTKAGYVETINVGDGNNNVTVGKGGAGVILAGRDQDRITVNGDVDSILAGHGDDTIKAGKGWVGTIDADRGNDAVILGSGGAGYISLGRDSDLIKVSRLADKSMTVVIDGGSRVSSPSNKDSDTIDFSAFTTKMTVALSGTYTVQTGHGNFLIRNFENATGGKGNDVLIGDDENNILRGGAGRDTLIGGKGADDLYGGKGADTFVFKSVTELSKSKGQTDSIFDFSRKEKDLIDFSGIDANTAKKGNQAFDFIGTDSFSKTAGELRYVKERADTYVYGDVNGDGKADFVLHIDNIVNFKAGDFIL